MPAYLVGVDVGTTVSKAVVVDVDGNIIGNGQREYSCIYPKQNWVEQNGEMLVKMTFEACREAVLNSGIDPAKIISVGFSTQRATFALLGENNEIIGENFYVWQDNRAASEIEYIASKISADELHEISGMPLTPTFSLEKIIWIMRNEPEKYRKARRIVQVPDYVMYRFGAEDLFTEVTNACSSGMIDIKKLCWSDKILNTFEIDRGKFPRLVNPGTSVGKVSKEAAEKTGLAAGTLLCSGSGDQQCASLGAGVIKDGHASMTLGTAGLLVVGTEKLIIEKKSGLMTSSTASLGLYELEGIQLGAASSYKWICDIIGGSEKAVSRDLGINPYGLIDQYLLKSPVGSNGIVFMPFLSGSGYPYWNSEAKGTFTGLKFSNTKSDMLRSVMEGITLESKDMYETMKSAGVKIKSLAITGGATKSPVWRQVIADMFNVEIKLLKVTDATGIGTAILAGVGSGLFKNAEEGVAKMVKFTDIIKPIAQNVEKYNKIYKIYKEIYEVFNDKGIYRKLSLLT